MMPAKFGNIKVFWNNDCYNIRVSVHDIINKILSRDSNYIVDVVMRPKFGNSSISMREVIITSILYGFDHKNQFFEGCSWFKFNNLGLALDMALKFYTSLVKGLKLKFRKFWGLLLTFVEVTKEKLIERPFRPRSWIWLKLRLLSLCYFQCTRNSEILFVE